MDFDREELQAALDIAKLAIDQREFIPILSHFCFSGKSITSYNDMIGIQVAFRTNFVCALQAQTLLKLVNSVASKDISIGFSDKTVYFKSGAARKGTRARLPYMNEDDFFFRWPNMKRLNGKTIKPDTAEKFLAGLELCLSSVGEQQPTQMGVTLHESGGYLRMYSTNNKALSRFAMKPAYDLFENDILPTAFCKALLRASQQFGLDDFKISKGKEFVIASFGTKCKIYTKLITNKDPLDFEKVVKQHLPKDHKSKKQKWRPDLQEAFQRALIMLSSELTRNCNVILDEKVVVVEARGPAGKLKSSAEFPKRLGVGSYLVDTDLALRALESTDYICFGKDSIVFSKGTYMHFLSTGVPVGKVTPVTSDDIPF